MQDQGNLGAKGFEGQPRPPKNDLTPVGAFLTRVTDNTRVIHQLPGYKLSCFVLRSLIVHDQGLFTFGDRILSQDHLFYGAVIRQVVHHV
jgi:hypothetical protein